jgi:glyoxylase-like metal-dependent hydrolase (beta-lactamase superfamily II)
MDIDELKKKGLRITSINEHIHVIKGTNRSRPPFSNSILILDRTNAILDTGCGLKKIEALCESVDIDLVINSHSHTDHTAGNWLMQEKKHPDIIVPEDNQESISIMDKLAVRFVGTHFAEEWKESTRKTTGFKDFTFSGTMSEGSEFNLGHTRFIAMYTPGHLNDHYCLWEPDQKILIGFDIDLSPFGPWYGDKESDLEAFDLSIERVKNIRAQTYISSHASPIQKKYIKKRLNAYRSIIRKRDQQIMEILGRKGGADLDKIVRASPIYHTSQNTADPITLYGERNMIKEHLGKLLKGGIIIRRDKRYFLS